MWISSISALIACCLAALASLPSAQATTTQQTLIASTITFRDLQLEDIPDVTSIFIAAFSPGPAFQYLTPDIKDHEKQFQQCMNDKLTLGWEMRNPNTTFGRIIAVDDKPVSFSIWDIHTQEEEVQDRQLVSLMRDCIVLPGSNGTRGLDFDRQMHDIERHYFRDVYPRELYLNLLATHPSWDGHGFATRHLQWGKDLSPELPGSEWPVTLLATPAGWPLYDSTGFEGVANVSIKRLDGLDELWFEVMKWNGK
jgi:hypothetical protein